MSERDEVPTFGRRVDDCPYVVRACAYALVRRGTAIAVVETDRGRFLPGGGLRPGEDAWAAVKREVMEECGLLVSPADSSIEGVEIVYSPMENTCFEKRSRFVTAKTLGTTTPTEPDHRLLWLSVPEALGTLSHESHRFAVRRLISTLRWEATSPVAEPAHPGEGPGMVRSRLLLVPHDPSWAAWFAAESKRVRSVLGDYALHVEHIGSTSIPGMLGKPIIDIAVVTVGIDGLSRCAQPLVDLGYDTRGQHGDDPLRRYFVLERGGVRIAQLHLWTAGADAWRSAIAFRELLTGSADLRAAYAESKIRAAEAAGWDKSEYSVAKGAFIESVIRSHRLPGGGADV